MSVGINISVKVIEDSFAQIESAMEAAISEAVEQAAKWVWIDAVAIIVANRFDTGNMAASTDHQMVGKFEAEVETDTDYARYQHDGFWHVRAGRFIPGVPFLVMAKDKNQRKFELAVKAAIRSAV